MRKFLCIVAMAMIALAINAKPITQEHARQRAVAFMKQRGDSRQLAPVVSKKRLAPRVIDATTAVAPYYVFDRGSNEGYVIVSGDDQTLDVLGYCNEGSFNYEQLPPALQELLNDYARQIELIQTGKAQAAPVIKAANRKKVEAMMKSKWSQGYPYNITCPLDAGKNSVTGCVATAMAQILYYHRDKNVTETQADMPAYTTWSKQLSVKGIAAGAPIDWENMKDTYSGSTTDRQKQAVANLMLYCGVGAKMDYTNESSGAQSWDAYNALKDYFGYSSAKWYDYQSVTSNEQWDEIVYNEMAAGRPVYVSGSNETVGHAFVADGYDGTRYHINWGWGGTSDSYYYLTNLTPGDGQGIGGSSDGYNEYKQIITNLEPENYMAKAMSIADATVKKICLANWDADGDGSLTYAEAAAVTDLGDVFKDNTTIKQFKELYYFTGLKKIADDAFNGCAQLTVMRLPKSIQTIGNRSFMGCAKLNQLEIFDALQTIGEDAFNGCKVLPAITLPNAMTAIPVRAFKDCAAFTSVSLPINITSIGEEAFAGCTKLKSFTVNTFQPSNISLGTSVFGDVDLQNATLHVMQGTSSFFTTAEQWKEFGTVHEIRELSGGVFAELEAGTTYYVYNVATGRYLTKGEAYGTQGIVGTEPMRFEVNRSSTMAEGTYYFSSPDTGKDGKYLFRTSTDSNVGNGVKATFIDGSLSSKAFWTIQAIGNQTYTIQTPSSQADYAEGCYLGVQTDHESGAASPTYGAYYDVSYAEHAAGCQWRFVAYDEGKTARYQAAQKLASLLAATQKKGLNHENEQAVYDNMESTYDELMGAQRTLRKKLNLIEFANENVRTKCLAKWDLDYDGELSRTEAARVSDFDISFEGDKTLESFDEFQYFTGVKYIYGRTFYGCINLKSITLPASLEEMYYYAFYNCKGLEEIRLPRYVSSIASSSFTACTNLKTVYVEAAEPFTIVANVFGTRQADAFTIYVPFGSKAKYEAADVWKNYTIKETRGPSQPKYSPFEVDKPGYFVNLGTGKRLSKGEAYGTQSIVDHQGMLYQLKRTKTMADGLYYFYSEETGSDQKKILFRVNTDSKVGEGVRACFVDGTLSAKAYWKIDSIAENVYTISLPATDGDYVAGQYLGTDYSHKSGAASPTYGIYWDIAGTGPNSQWAFVTQYDMDEAKAFDETVAELARLLAVAKEKAVDVQAEQAVYDNPASNVGNILDAIESIRQKLHFIIFEDDAAKSLCLTKWDVDGDGELSYEEAAAVSDIGETFRNKSNIVQLNELRYFTSLKAVPENAFRSASSLQSVILPESVDTICNMAFYSTGLRYLVMLNAEKKVPFGSSCVPANSTIFVPAAMLTEYQNDSLWTAKATVTEYTGIPEVTAEASRIYGRKLATVTMKVTGAPVIGTPDYVCDEIADAKTPVGQYPIVLTPGQVMTSGVKYTDGVFTVEPATVTVTARSYQRAEGTENPVFEADYKGFRNSETADVLTVKPTFSCEATADSPAGEYEITVGGAEAANYVFSYVPGVLTVLDPAGIAAVTAADVKAGKVFDLQGRRTTTLKRGVYILNGRKIVVK
jgi:hypothetical protein